MKTTKLVLITLLFAGTSLAQVPMATQIQILKAEDARRYDAVLENLLKSPNADIRKRAALAAGRIGREEAVPALVALLEKDPSSDVWVMAVFALGEIESIKAADAILKVLNSERAAVAQAETRPVGSVSSTLGNNTLATARVSARSVEAAGKIAAANAKDPKAKELARAVVFTLEAELVKGGGWSKDTIMLGLTAALRARPDGAEETVRKFLVFTDPDIVANALNTLARLRAKNANRDARDLLATHPHAIVRANAARVLGAAEDKEAVDFLVKAATSDSDARVRVSAIRALGAIKATKSADPLLLRAETLLGAYKRNLKPNYIPVEQSEFLEISSALGQILAKTGNVRAIALFRDFAKVDRFKTTEPYVARVKVGGIRPGAGLADDAPAPNNWRQYSTLAQVVGELSAYEPESPEAKKIMDEAPGQIRKLAKAFIGADAKLEPEAVMAAPDALRAFARFKTPDLEEVLLEALDNREKERDVFTRAAAAELLSELPSSKKVIDALETAYDVSSVTDAEHNDVQLAVLDALYKLDKKEGIDKFIGAIYAQDYLVRKKGFEILADQELQKEFPVIETSVRNARREMKHQVLPYGGVHTKLGQILNSEADYRRALSRKNGTVRAVVTTAKGAFNIDLLPEDAPLTVDNFIKLARSGYFNGLEVHRVVPNFVMQDGDPRGDGNGGPGWSIRCEINMVPYERGAVGMALSGKDTGGSQWFVTHSPQPHLDGGYTVFGKVNDAGMKVVDNIVRGDRITSIRIVESLNRRDAETRRKQN